MIAFAVGASAQPGWLTYVHPGYQTQITYPAFIFAAATEIPTGILLTGPEATLEVSAIAAPEIRTVADLRAFMTTGPGYGDVTYSPQGRSWLVLSGYRGDRVFYEKFFIVGGTIQGFSFEYPIANRSYYDPLVEVLEDSFRAGTTARF